MPAPPPAGWDPNAPVIPPWVDPNSGYVDETDYDKTPMRAWYPNGQYQWDDPYLNGDAFMRSQKYPRYGAYGPIDPNWRPSFFGETPPWQINPNDPWAANRSPGEWFGNSLNGPPPPANTPEELARFAATIEANKQAKKNTYEPDRMQRQLAQEAGAVFVRDNKNQRWGVYYPPGYKGPKVNPDKSHTPDHRGITEIGDPRQLGTEGKDWQVFDLKGGYEFWDNQPTMSFADAQSRNQASNIPPGPEPEVVPPGKAASTPQMSWEEQEAARRADWEAGGRKGTEYFDRYGNYHSDGFSSGPKQTPEEQQYYAQLRQTDPRIAKAYMFDAGDWQGQDMLNNMRAVKGMNGTQRMMWNPDRQSQIDQSFTPEQRAAAEAKMNAFNQQFDPNNSVNPADDKIYKVAKMSPQLRQTLMANQAQSTPAQKAAWAQWGDALTRFNNMQAPKPQPMPGPNPFMAPQPSKQPAQPAQQDRQFANNNPFMNANGELRNRAVKKLGHMVSRVQQGPNFNPFS